jgi:hypothetical protein
MNDHDKNNEHNTTSKGEEGQAAENLFGFPLNISAQFNMQLLYLQRALLSGKMKFGYAGTLVWDNWQEAIEGI